MLPYMMITAEEIPLTKAISVFDHSHPPGEFPEPSPIRHSYIVIAEITELGNCGSNF